MRVAVMVYSGARLFDVTVAKEVWRSDQLPIEVMLCSPEGSEVTLGGFTLAAAEPLSSVVEANLVIVPGADDPRLIGDTSQGLHPVAEWAYAAHEAGAVVASHCSGAFALAAAGLLNERPATTHWQLADDFSALFPLVHLDATALWCRSDRIWTSAGTVAGVDLSLALISEYLGPRYSTASSQRLIAAPCRPGNQAQFISYPVPAKSEDSIAYRLAEIIAREGTRWTFAEIAKKLYTSETALARNFRKETGTTVHQWLIQQRIEHARLLLAESDLSIEDVTQKCGFDSAINFRQRFREIVGMPPSNYRAVNRR